MPPHAGPSFTFTSFRITHRYPGLGRVLGSLALLLSVGSFVVGVLAAVLAPPSLRPTDSDVLAWSGPSFLAGIHLALMSALVTAAYLSQRGAVLVAAGADGLSLTRGAATRRIPRAAIRSGLVVPEPRSRVALELRGGRQLEVQVKSEEEGARLLAALGLDPEARRVEVSLGSAGRELATGCVGLPVVMIVWLLALWLCSAVGLLHANGVTLLVSWLSLTLLSAWLIRRAARPVRIVVGSDGVLVERPFSRDWLPCSDLAEIEARDGHLLLRRGHGRPIELVAGRDLADALAQRIREARERGTGGAAPRGAEALERRGRDLATWREDLRKLLLAGDYRTTGLTLEDARHILGDPSAPPDRRLSAALLLRIAAHPEAQGLIRIAAETTADDGLRAALERAAEDEIDEAALTRAARWPSRSPSARAS
jgi:hypothetical protein